MEYVIANHILVFPKTVRPLDAAVVPEATVQAFRASMHTFPLGALEYLPVADLETPTLFYDIRRSVFFSASLEDILDLYSRHLNAAWRAEQKKRITKLYWQQRAAVLSRSSV